MANSGKDLIDSTFGEDGENLASGKGIQQVHIDLGNKSASEIAEIMRMVPRLTNAVFGDGYNWIGVVDDLRALKKEVQTLTSRLQNMETKISEMKIKLDQRTEASDQMHWLLIVGTVGTVILVAVQLWPF